MTSGFLGVVAAGMAAIGLTALSGCDASPDLPDELWRSFIREAGTELAPEAFGRTVDEAASRLKVVPVRVDCRWPPCLVELELDDARPSLLPTGEVQFRGDAMLLARELEADLGLRVLHHGRHRPDGTSEVALWAVPRTPLSPGLMESVEPMMVRRLGERPGDGSWLSK